jgi:lipopolysaccharide transport system permease protein
VKKTASPSLLSLLNPGHSAGSLWRYRELVWQFTARSIEIRHRGSVLGLLWSFLRPLLALGTYMFVFRYLFNGHFGVLPHETSVDYALGIFSGLCIFQMLAEVIAVSATTIVLQPNFVKRVVFPLEILPVASVGASIFHFLVSLLLLCLGALLVGPGLGWTAFWLPVIVLPVVLMALGLGWLISALGVFLRDIAQAAEFLTMVLMYASAVFYSPSRIPSWAWPFLRFNPVIYAIDLSRNALLWHLPLSFAHLAYLYCSGTATFLIGYVVFTKLKPAFADVV